MEKPSNQALMNLDLEMYVDDDAPSEAVELPLGDKLITGLSTLLRTGKQLNELVEVGKTFRIRLPPELAADVASGRLSMMQAASGGIRSAIVNEKATIVGSGSFHAIASAPLVAAALWQLAAKITAQHFLAEIDAKLASIDSKLGELKHAMQDVWKGQLHGNARKLSSIAKEFLQHELSEHEVQGHLISLEAIDREARATAAQAQLRAQRVHSAVQALEPKVGVTSDRLETKAKKLAEALHEIDECGAQEYFALYVRALCAQVRCSVPASTSAATKDRVAEVHDELRGAMRRSEELLDVARERIAWLKGLTTTEKRDDETRRRLLDQRRGIVLRSHELATQVSKTVTSVRKRLEAGATRDIWLKIGPDGAIAGARVLRMSAMSDDEP